MTWHTAQIGAREHYAIPRALHREERLGRLYTDFWAGSLLRHIGPVKSRGRFHQELAEAPVSRFLVHSLIERCRPAPKNCYDGFLETGRAFSRTVARRLPKVSMADQLFFAYDTGFLEAAQTARSGGARTIVNQIDPATVEFAIVREEEQAFPGWTTVSLEIPEAYNRRREAEWALADRIVVNSTWSAGALEQQGVPQEKIVVIPLAYEASARNPELASKEDAAGHPLKILFLGQVILRKGIQYLIQTAELLAHEPVHFDIVGPLGINLRAIPSIPSNLTFHGPVPRSEVDRFYRQSVLFALPTLSDGFAITQLEAMAHGLPVLATRACGEVVTEGIDGWLLPARDPQAWADRIREVLDQRELLGPMSAAAIEKSKQFGLDRLAKNLLALEQELLTANS